MVQASGALATVMYVDEVTYGVTPASPSMHQLLAATPGVSLKENIQELVSNALNGSRSILAARAGNRSVAGALPVELPIEGLGRLLVHAIGPVVTTGAGPYTHVIKRGALPVGISFEIGYPDITQYQVFSGCRLGGLNLSVPDSGLITGSLDVIGQAASAFTGTPLDASPTVPEHDPYAEIDATFEEGGAAFSNKMTALTMALTNNLEPRPVAGSARIVSANAGRGTMRGQITSIFDSPALINKALAETESSLKATFTRGANSLEVFMPSVKYFGDAGAGIETDQGLLVTLDYVATYDVTEATDIRVTIVNDESAIG